jgi:hypothetical protein
MAVSLRLQLRSPPLVRDPLLPLMAPPLLYFTPLAHLQHLSSPLEAPMAVSLKLQLRSPPLVKDPLLPLMAPPLPFGSSGAASALPGPGPGPGSLPLALIPEEAAPPSRWLVA